MKIMMVGDVVGRAGRRAFTRHTPELKKKYGVDVIVVNGENAAGGKGLTSETLQELYSGGADVVTSGNHIWDKKEVLQFIDREPFLLRPANYPGNAPGHGFCVYPYRAVNIGVLNLSGRTFMNILDCPFQTADHLLSESKNICDITVVDFHAEATSEKAAMGWYLDGRVDCVFGTHTHVQTADERILPDGTAYITDVGMVGAWDSILGVNVEQVLKKFTAGLPTRFEPADGAAVYSAVVVEFDESAHRAQNIKRVFLIDT